MRPEQPFIRIAVLLARATPFDWDRYHQLAAVADVTVVRLGAVGETAKRRAIHGTLREVVVARSSQHAETEHALAQGIPIDVTRAVLVRLLSSTPEFAEALYEIRTDIDVCFVADSGLGDVAAAMLRVPLVYDAPRIERGLPNVTIAGSHLGTLLGDLKAAEARLLAAALTVIVRGGDDAAALRDVCAYPHAPAVIATGVSHDSQRFTTFAQRRNGKAAMQMSDRTIALFEGHGEIADAGMIVRLGEIAQVRSNVLFFVTGPYPPNDYPPNVRFFEAVSESDAAGLRKIADVAVIAHDGACGTIVQTLTAALAGIPLVATPAAVTNLALEPGRDFLCGGIDQCGELLTRVLDDPVAAEARAVSAYAALLAAAPPTLTALSFQSFLEQLRAATPVVA